MSKVLSSLATLSYAIRHVRLVSIGLLLAMAISVILIALARPDTWADTNIYTYSANASPITLIDKYVRVQGTLMPSQAVTGQASAGQIRLQGSRFVPVLIAGAPDPVYVLDRGLPAVPAEGGPVDIVGLLQTKESFPSIYVTVGNPPDIPLQNLLARIGIVVGALGLVALVLSAVMARMHFAPGLSVSPGASDTGLAWYGGLGPAEGNATVMGAPVSLARNAREIRLAASQPGEGWAVLIRRVLSAQPVTVATAQGALPAIRVRFADERDKERDGTVVAGDIAARDALLAMLPGTGAAQA
jgi:hypothetical protein